MHNGVLDDALYPGHVVKKMLEEAGRNADLHWIKLPLAADILENEHSALRKKCVRWERMAHPPVRVRKQGPSAASHWLLCEEDVYALRRKSTMCVIRDEHVEIESAWAGLSEEEATVAHWCNVATENL